MTIVDTSVIYALLDQADRWHERVVAWYRAERPTLVTTPLVLAEVDHLSGARAGTAARAAWRRDVAAGAYAIEWWSSAPREIVNVAQRYEDLGIDLTDVSLMVLASRLRTADIATLDERHFRAVRPLTSHPAYRLLPIDV